MTDTGSPEQRKLGAYGDDGGNDARPDEEALAVAGDARQRVSDVVDAADLKFPDPDGTLELSVTQVDYTIEGQGREEYPVINVFGRTPDGDPEHVRVLGFEPYFYAPTESLTDEKLDKDVITRTEEGYESIRGEALTKICTRTPRDVGQIRDEFDHFEADILFPNRFLIDKDVGSGIRVPDRRLDSGVVQVPHDEVEATDVEADLRVNTFDIEVDDRAGFPEDGEEAILCLTSHDSTLDEYVVWIQAADGGDGDVPTDLSDHDLLDETATVDVRRFDAEAAMLDAFLEYVEETDPDVLTGWNFEDFDAPYFIDRLEVLDPETEYDLDPERLSRVGEVWRSDWGGPTVKGRVVFDLLYAYKRTQFTELESYRLDAVGEQELGVGKERYAGDIGDLWEDDPKRLLEYNLRDVELCVELDRKQEIIPFWNEVRSFVGCKLEDAPTPGDAVDVYVLHKVHGQFALPSKGRTDAEEYEGGAVFDPITGVKENVSVLDLKCFSGDTDVLTPEGPRNIRDLDVGDEIYTLNPETFECEVEPVAETHAYENSYGELHHLSGNTHDFKVTENHRFLASKRRGWDDLAPEDFEFTEYRNLTDTERYAFPTHDPMRGRTPETFDLVDEVEGGHVVVYSDGDLREFRGQMPDDVLDHLDLAHGTSQAMGLQRKVGKYLLPLSTYREHRDVVDAHADDVFLKYGRGHCETQLSFEMTDWLELLGWYVTEGSADLDAGRFTLHQSDEDGRADIRALLERMDVDHNVDDRGVHVSNRYLVEWLTEHCGKGYATKRLPDWMFELDGELLRALLDTLVRGDGQTTESGLQQFWTKSDDLKDAVVDVAVRCGEKPTATKQADGTWYVSIGKRGSFEKATNATVESHDGNVYCVTAEDNHVVLAGRNGHFQWVGQSLYPMCMVTINASPETKVDPETYDGDTYRAPNGTHFRAEPDGIIRAMVDELLTEREQKKSKRNEFDPGSQDYEQFDRQQQAVKVIMNSLYGVLGWARFRLYDKEMGAAVTATGRDVIEFTESVASEMGYEVAYGDTDSVMLEIEHDLDASVDVPENIRDAHPNMSDDELRTLVATIDAAYDIEERINEAYDEFAREELDADEHRFQIEFEKLYRRFFQAGKKKRYAGHIVWKEGKHVDDVDITGFEYKRSDIAPITKEVQKRVLEMIVHGEGTEEIKSYVHDVIEDFREGNVSLDDVGIPGGIGKRLDAYDTDTAQVRGAKYANTLLGTNFQRGSKPKRLYLDRVHSQFFREFEADHPELFESTDLSREQRRLKDTYLEFKNDPDVVCFEYADQIPEAFEVDWDKMLDKTLKGPIARIIESLGMSWGEVKSGQQQTGLGQFG
ncbi:MAG: DNA polymerase domain-containing protein [Haloferacaceae archaeon]